MTMADDAIEDGTPPIKRHLLPDDVAQKINPTSPPKDVGEALGNLADMIYPIGSIYMSVNNVNPTQLFGGTWTRYAEGRVLMGVTGNAASNVEAGANTRTLPAHTHVQTVHNHTMGAHQHVQSQHQHIMSDHAHVQTQHYHTVGAHTHALNTNGTASIHLTTSTLSMSAPVSATNSWARRARVSVSGTNDGQSFAHGVPLIGNTGAMNGAAHTGWSPWTLTGGMPHSLSTGWSEATNTGAMTSATVTTANSATANTGAITGTAPTIDVRQPSVTCFIWQRTA